MQRNNKEKINKDRHDKVYRKPKLTKHQQIMKLLVHAATAAPAKIV